MSIHKIYIIVTEDLGSFGLNYPIHKGSHLPHYEVFFEKLKSHIEIPVSLLYVKSFLEIPEDGLIIVYASEKFLEIFYSHPKCSDLGFVRRFFIIGVFSGSHENRIITPSSFKKNSFIGVFYPVAYGSTIQSQANDIANIPVYYWLDILAMENNVKTWDKKYQIDVVDFYLSGTKYLDYKPRTNSIQELCVFLEEYIQKFDILKEINHFDDSEEMKAKVLRYFGKKEVKDKKTNIFQKIINFFKFTWFI